ncbi:MAG: ribonuclease J, partial [Anaerolineae bacterium]|nr:ribonuclease J [Anaerolineae bacterium]
MSEYPLRVIPLGGVGEIGKNLMVLEYDQQILVIDVGLMFPESDMLGIDLVYPDITYLPQRADRVQAVILTHGHEDHIGALPYLLKYLDVPVYATPLTRGLAEVKLKEAGLLAEAELHTITPADVLTLGPFQVEFFHVCHSIPDAIGVAVTTPVGLVIHASDYKFDQQPVDGRLTDVEKLRALGDRGVLLLLSDSTNADTEGFTPSEQRVTDALERIMARATGRVLVATFASNISRIQQVIQVARRYGRRVGVVGRSMVSNVRMAIHLGYLDITAEDLLTTSEMNNLPREEVVIVCTGSQGEPTSVLARLANEEHAQLQIVPGDTVVLSATPIPGNEETVNHVIDDLFRLGADVIYSDLSDVHVSGHGSREDHKMMISLVRPRFFVPMHGEYRHLVLHARTAQEMGIPPEHIVIVESGQVVEVGPHGIRPGERVSEGLSLIHISEPT